MNAKNRKNLHNFFDAIYPIPRQFWRDSGLISKMHKNRPVQRAGEAGEQARALGGRQGGVCLRNRGLSRAVLPCARSGLARGQVRKCRLRAAYSASGEGYGKR